MKMATQKPHRSRLISLAGLKLVTGSYVCCALILVLFACISNIQLLAECKRTTTTHHPVSKLRTLIDDDDAQGESRAMVDDHDDHPDHPITTTTHVPKSSSSRKKSTKSHSSRASPVTKPKGTTSTSKPSTSVKPKGKAATTTTKPAKPSTSVKSKGKATTTTTIKPAKTSTSVKPKGKATITTPTTKPAKPSNSVKPKGKAAAATTTKPTKTSTSVKPEDNAAAATTTTKRYISTTSTKKTGDKTKVLGKAKMEKAAKSAAAANVRAKSLDVTPIKEKLETALKGLHEEGKLVDAKKNNTIIINGRKFDQVNPIECVNEQFYATLMKDLALINPSETRDEYETYYDSERAKAISAIVDTPLPPVATKSPAANANGKAAGGTSRSGLTTNGTTEELDKSMSNEKLLTEIKQFWAETNRTYVQTALGLNLKFSRRRRKRDSKSTTTAPTTVKPTATPTTTKPAYLITIATTTSKPVPLESTPKPSQTTNSTQKEPRMVKANYKKAVENHYYLMRRLEQLKTMLLNGEEAIIMLNNRVKKLQHAVGEDELHQALCSCITSRGGRAALMLISELFTDKNAMKMLSQLDLAKRKSEDAARDTAEFCSYWYGDTLRAQAIIKEKQIRRLVISIRREFKRTTKKTTSTTIEILHEGNSTKKIIRRETKIQVITKMVEMTRLWKPELASWIEEQLGGNITAKLFEYKRTSVNTTSHLEIHQGRARRHVSQYPFGDDSDQAAWPMSTPFDHGSLYTDVDDAENLESSDMLQSFIANNYPAGGFPLMRLRRQAKGSTSTAKPQLSTTKSTTKAATTAKTTTAKATTAKATTAKATTAKVTTAKTLAAKATTAKATTPKATTAKDNGKSKSTTKPAKTTAKSSSTTKGPAKKPTGKISKENSSQKPKSPSVGSSSFKPMLNAPGSSPTVSTTKIPAVTSTTGKPVVGNVTAPIGFEERTSRSANRCAIDGFSVLLDIAYDENAILYETSHIKRDDKYIKTLRDTYTGSFLKYWIEMRDRWARQFMANTIERNKAAAKAYEEYSKNNSTFSSTITKNFDYKEFVQHETTIEHTASGDTQGQLLHNITKELDHNPATGYSDKTVDELIDDSLQTTGDAYERGARLGYTIGKFIGEKAARQWPDPIELNTFTYDSLFLAGVGHNYSEEQTKQLEKLIVTETSKRVAFSEANRKVFARTLHTAFLNGAFVVPKFGVLHGQRAVAKRAATEGAQLGYDAASKAAAEFAPSAMKFFQLHQHQRQLAAPYKLFKQQSQDLPDTDPNKKKGLVESIDQVKLESELNANITKITLECGQRTGALMGALMALLVVPEAFETYARCRGSLEAVESEFYRYKLGALRGYELGESWALLNYTNAMAKRLDSFRADIGRVDLPGNNTSSNATTVSYTTSTTRRPKIKKVKGKNITHIPDDNLLRTIAETDPHHTNVNNVFQYMIVNYGQRLVANHSKSSMLVFRSLVALDEPTLTNMKEQSGDLVVTPSEILHKKNRTGDDDEEDVFETVKIAGQLDGSLSTVGPNGTKFPMKLEIIDLGPIIEFSEESLAAKKFLGDNSLNSFEVIPLTEALSQVNKIYVKLRVAQKGDKKDTDPLVTYLNSDQTDGGDGFICGSYSLLGASRKREIPSATDGQQAQEMPRETQDDIALESAILDELYERIESMPPGSDSVAITEAAMRVTTVAPSKANPISSTSNKPAVVVAPSIAPPSPTTIAPTPIAATNPASSTSAKPATAATTTSHPTTSHPTTSHPTTSHPTTSHPTTGHAVTTTKSPMAMRSSLDEELDELATASTKIRSDKSLNLATMESRSGLDDEPVEASE